MGAKSGGPAARGAQHQWMRVLWLTGPSIHRRLGRPERCLALAIAGLAAERALGEARLVPAAPRRFGYYRRLSASNRAVYRSSDAVARLVLREPAAAQPWVAAIEAALLADDRRAVQRAAHGLGKQLCADLEVPVVPVRVLARRPANAVGELHGLYLRHADGRTLIRVWMRTAAHERVVAFRTFLRTLLHELCHHFDYEHLALADSYHTQGFFQRESSLVRQLAPKRASDPDPELDAEPLGQLELPGF
jgi:hypothetical protein